MKSPHHECELKLELTPDQLRRLKSRETIAGLDAAPPLKEKLRSLHFDTRDWALRSQGLSLSLHPSGEGWVQTLTTGSQERPGALEPEEFEADVAADQPAIDAIPDKALRGQISKLVGDARLVRVFETLVDRTFLRLTTGNGDDVELVLGDGTVMAKKHKERFRVVEIALKAGQPEALLEIARRIAGDGPLRASHDSTADRGYRLAGETNESKTAPSKAKRSTIEPGCTGGEAMAEICRAAVAHCLHNWRAVVEGDDPEAVHQMRVGLRRLRAALRILRSWDESDRLRALDVRLRDLGRAVGRLRDADVLLSDIVAPLAGTAHVAHGISVLRRRLAQERQNRRSQVLKALETPEICMLELELGLLPCMIVRLAQAGHKHLDKPVTVLAEKALHKLLARVSKRGQRMSELTIAERHELRKAMKSLRYGVEFFAPLYPAGRMKRLQSCSADLQDVLGYLNDVALAEQLLSADLAGDQVAPEAVRTVGAVIGWHSAQAEHAWASANHAWKRFEKAAKLIE